MGGAKKATCSLSASRPGIAATVRRAIKTHASCEDISLTPSLHGTYDRPECVAAAGRVFGAGCREVESATKKMKKMDTIRNMKTMVEMN